MQESIDRTPNINKRYAYVKRIFKPQNLQLIDVFRKCNKDNKNIIMSSFKSSRDIQKKEGGPDSCFG